MADVETKGVVTENTSGCGVELSSARRNVYKQLKITVKYVAWCKMYRFNAGGGRRAIQGEWRILRRMCAL